VVKDRPSYETLKRQYIESGNNMTKLGKMYGVSDNSVNKWIKTYEKELNIESFKKKIKNLSILNKNYISVIML
jgi:transposase-like protein